jgi:hypothetical protein
MNAIEANAVQAWLSTAMTRRPQRVNEGAGHSAFGFAFCTLRHLCSLLTLRLPKGLAWCCDLLLPARHLSFGRVTRRGLSGRWHFDLLHVSNGHNVKNRPHVAGNQDPRLRDDDMAANRRDFFTNSNLRASHLCRSPPRRNRRIHLRRFDGAKGGRRPVSVRRC